jgi:MFS transporter, DHA1 family, multidrug resistance protein
VTGVNDPSLRVSQTRIALILSTMSVFGPFATDMYLASFPDIGRSLSTSQGMVQLTLSLYLIGLAVGQVLYGPLSDAFGRRKPLLAGIALATISSLLAALAPTIETLIGLRFVQAVGGCVGMVIGRAVVRDLYDVGNGAKVMSVVMSVQSLGPMVAPALGGLLLLVTGWRSLFLTMTLLGAASWYVVWRYLPETLPEMQRQPLSFVNLRQGSMRVLRTRTFIVPALASCVAMCCMFTFITGSPFVFMQLHGVSPQQYGYLFGLTALGLFLAAHLNRWLLRRHTPALIFLRTLQFNAVAAVVLVAVANTPHLWLLMLPLFVCVATVPLLLANGSVIAMAASGSDVGSASSLLGVMQFGFASLISALLGAFYNGTAYPMAGMMLAISVLGNLVYILRRRDTA